MIPILFSLEVSGEPLILALGETKTLQGRPSRLWISDPKVLRGDWVGGKLLLRARKTGFADVRWNDVNHRVYVWSPSAARTWPPLRKFVSRTPGLEASTGERGPILTGRLYSLQDLDALINILPDDAHWENRASIPPGLLQNWLNARLRQAGFNQHPLVMNPNPHVRVRKIEAALERALARLGVGLVEDAGAVTPQPVIRVEIAVAEVRRDRRETLGLRPPTSATAQLLPEGPRFSAESLFQANFLEESGHGRLLARPNLICRSGAEAEFLAGGEIPVRLIGEQSSTVVWKRYGIMLKVRPLADTSGRISLQLDTEVSTIDKSRDVDGLPGMLTNKVSSHFDLLGPRTIALSGLIQHQDGVSQSGVWGLSSLPILGPLFSSRSWQNLRTELVIFVRPEILNEGTP